MLKARKIAMLTAIMLLIVGWLLIAGLNLFCAISLQCVSEASSWWSLFLTTVGVPVLVFQLYSLRKTIKESAWEPILDIGLMVAPTDYQAVFSGQYLPTRQKYDPAIWSKLKDVSAEHNILTEMSPFQLVIRNSGKRAAKNLKIHINCDVFPGNVAPAFFMRGKEFSTREGVTGYTFYGGESRAVHPKDFEGFQIGLMRNLDEVEGALYDLKHSPTGISVVDIVQPGTYRFQCKIWADGLNQPLEKVLEIDVLHSDVRIVNPYFESDVYQAVKARESQLSSGGSPVEPPVN